MMGSVLQRRFLLTLAVASGFLASCQSEESTGKDKADKPAVPGAQGVEDFFAPQPGESWTYRVQREIPLGVNLTPEDRARHPERTETGQLVLFERRRTCAGVEKPEGADQPLTVIDVYEDDEHRGRELYDINPKGVFSRGWLSSEEDGASEVLEDGIAIALRNLQAGSSWDDTGRDTTRRFVFRVIERVQLELQAGKFDTARIQITSGNQGGVTLKRTIWFAENVGIVKEETVKYGPDRVIGREWAELVSWRLPDESQAQVESP